MALVTGCSLATHAPPGLLPTEIVVDRSKAGSVVSLQRGDKLIVILPGNPSTGFAWQQTWETGPVLVQQGEPIYTCDGKALGAGGRYRFTYVAAVGGIVPVRLIYSRPFEPGSPAATAFDVTVEVRE